MTKFWTGLNWKHLQMTSFLVDRLENIAGKRENADYQHFLLTPSMFSKVIFLRVLKSRDWVGKGLSQDFMVKDSCNWTCFISSHKLGFTWDLSYLNAHIGSIMCDTLHGNTQIGSLTCNLPHMIIIFKNSARTCTLDMDWLLYVSHITYGDTTVMHR